MTPASLRSAFTRLAISAAVALVAGCGSGARPHRASTAPAHSSFLTAVSDVCARAVSAHAGHPFPVSDFDPDHPDPDQLPAVGDYLARYGGLTETLAGLHSLDPPTSDVAAWRGLLAVADQIRDNARRQVDAARSKDFTTFVTTVHTAQHLTDELDSKGARFGFTSDSPCRQVFG